MRFKWVAVALVLAACATEPASLQSAKLTFSVIGDGDGNGTVLSLGARLIDCAITQGVTASTGCTAAVDSGESLRLLMTPANGSILVMPPLPDDENIPSVPTPCWFDADGDGNPRTCTWTVLDERQTTFSVRFDAVSP